jgi:hypothetical protein
MSGCMTCPRDDIRATAQRGGGDSAQDDQRQIRTFTPAANDA